MTIEYLTQLRDNPVEYPDDASNRFENEGVSESEILQLEQLYNNGNPFPKALKELLCLAGNFCYVFDYNIHNNQQEIQEWVREDMVEMNRIISRPFYAFDLYSGFLFIYLDEGDNPDIYEAQPFSAGNDWIRKTSNTIKSLSEKRILRVKEGLNPF